MNNFLRRKTYRTCAVLISGAAMVMAATVVNENSDNNIAKKEAVNRQAISNHKDTGDSDEEVVPGYLSLDRVYLGTVEKEQEDKPLIEAVMLPQVFIPKEVEAGLVEEAIKNATEKAENVQAVEKTTDKTEAVQEAENESEIQKAEGVQENESEIQNAEAVQENVQASENPTENTADLQAVENETKKPEELQEDNNIPADMENNESIDSEEHTAVMGSAVKINNEEYESLQRIVEAEAGNQDDIGRILVANVVLNRVKSELYPDNILDNIFRHSGDIYQFQPVKNGTYYSVTVSEKTKECVDRALAGEDYSDGALYFTRKTSENSWFNTSLTLLFVHGAHYFYK